MYAVVRSLYGQVLIATIIGVALGHFFPAAGASMKPLGDAFIKLVRMIVAPVVFCTVVVGIAGVGDVKAVGKAGVLTLIYFEIVSTIALVIGLIVVNIVKPGAGMNVDPAALDAGAVAQYVTAGRGQHITDFLLGIIPTSAADAFARSDILQVLLCGGLPPMPHDWREAGDAWGHAANDWACLMEHYSVDAVTTMFARLGVGPDVRLLDIACGAGAVTRRAAAMGAEVAGIDAAEELIDVAQLRLPEADIRIGSMFELPWPDESFDVAVSINGIWGGNERALDEAHRVLRPGGGIGISFWGTGPPVDFKPVFRVVAAHSPDVHVGGMREVNNIAFEGVAEKMLTEAGFVDLERGSASRSWSGPIPRSRGARSRAWARSSLHSRTPITRC